MALLTYGSNSTCEAGQVSLSHRYSMGFSFNTSYSGWLLDKYFAPRDGMALLFSTAVGLGLLSIAHPFGAAALAAALIGFSIGGEAHVTPYLLARYFGAQKLGLLCGWGWTAFAMAAALGSVLLGRALTGTALMRAS